MSHAAVRARPGQDRTSLYQEITDKIIAELEAGRLPWVQPWGTSAVQAPLAMPKNAATARRYSGINVLILWGAVVQHGFPGQSWLTFRQALSLGGNVRKGERGTTVVFADRFIPDQERARAREQGDEPNAIPFLKRFTVFNVAQCDGLPTDLVTVSPPVPDGLILPEVEALTASLRFHPRCYYRPDQHAPTETWPAMIAAVTDLSGAITGAHRTWLDPNGERKAPVDTPRRAMGHLLGHAVRFDVAHDVLAVGEGIETMLSLRCVLPTMPMVAALSAAHLAAILFPATLRRLYVARDDDPAGDAAVASLTTATCPRSLSSPTGPGTPRRRRSGATTSCWRCCRSGFFTFREQASRTTSPTKPGSSAFQSGSSVRTAHERRLPPLPSDGNILYCYQRHRLWIYAIMPAVTIRNLSDETHRALKIRAAQHNRSTEAEMRAILEAAVRPEGRLRLGTALAEMSRKIGLSNADVEALEQTRDTKPAEPLHFE